MPQRQLLDFDPARDGFSFANVFAWTREDLLWVSESLRWPAAAVALALPTVGAAASGRALGGAVTGAGLAAAGFGGALVRGLARRHRTFGLCGGMAAMAVDRWPATRIFTCDLRREAVRPMLRDWQADTIRAAGPQFLLHWLACLSTPMQEGPLHDTRAVVEEVRSRIDSGKPLVLGLVGDSPSLFAQHQVVCFGYECNDPARPDDVTLFVYDPNAPGTTRHLHFRAHLGAEGISIRTDLSAGRLLGGGAPLISRTPGTIGRVFVVHV